MTTWEHSFFPNAPLKVTPNGSVAGWAAPHLARELRRLARDGGFWRESHDGDNLNLSLINAIRLAEEGLGDWGTPTRAKQVYAFAAKSWHNTSAELRRLTAAHTELEAVSEELARLTAENWVILAKSWK